MPRRFLLALCLILTGALAWVALGSFSALGQAKKVGKQYLNFAAPAFTPVDESTHNNMGETVCVNFQDRGPGDFADENNADLNAVTGSYLHTVTLPNKATITDLHLLANDNDGDDNAFVFLVRKQMTPNLSPAGGGYEVIAQVNSDGAENNVLRRFSDTTIDNPLVNNRTHYYMLELVNCAVIEPYVVQVGYRPKAKRRK
jgi:hypothetical protein